MSSFVSVKSYAKQTSNLGPRPSVADAVTFAVRLPAGKPYVNIGFGSDIMAAQGWNIGDRLEVLIDNENGQMAFVKVEKKGIAIRSAYSNKGVTSKHGCITFPVYEGICVAPTKFDADKVSFGASEGKLLIDLPKAALKQ